MGAMQQSLLATGAAAVANTLDTVEFVCAGNFVSGTGAITVIRPASFIEGDLFVLVVTSTNQTITGPSGWTQVTNSPQGTGTAGASQSIACAVYTRTANGTTGNAAIGDTGVLTTGAIFAFRKVDNTTPVEVTSGSVQATAATTHTLPAVTTSTNNCMIAHCAGIGRDAISTANYTSPTNANLTDLAVRMSQTTSTANGGGIGMVTGTKTSAGSTGTTSVTVAALAKGAFVTLGLKPSTNYDTVVRVLGTSSSGFAYTDLYDQTYNSSPASAGITLNSDGTITAFGNLTNNARAAWLTNSTDGASYYVQATTISGSGTGTVGSWLQLNTNRTWQVDATEATNSWQIRLDFSTSAGGPIVARCTVDMTAESNVGPIP